MQLADRFSCDGMETLGLSGCGGPNFRPNGALHMEDLLPMGDLELFALVQLGSPGSPVRTKNRVMPPPFAAA
ncbi:MAG: hypothetical protein WCB34_07975 [Methylovirgula sp.]